MRRRLLSRLDLLQLDFASKVCGNQKEQKASLRDRGSKEQLINVGALYPLAILEKVDLIYCTRTHRSCVLQNPIRAWTDNYKTSRPC